MPDLQRLAEEPYNLAVEREVEGGAVEVGAGDADLRAAGLHLRIARRQEVEMSGVGNGAGLPYFGSRGYQIL